MGHVCMGLYIIFMLWMAVKRLFLLVSYNIVQVHMCSNKYTAWYVRERCAYITHIHVFDGLYFFYRHDVYIFVHIENMFDVYGRQLTVRFFFLPFFAICKHLFISSLLFSLCHMFFFFLIHLFICISRYKRVTNTGPISSAGPTKAFFLYTGCHAGSSVNVRVCVGDNQPHRGADW